MREAAKRYGALLHDAADAEGIDVEITQEPEDFDSVVDATEAAGKGED